MPLLVVKYYVNEKKRVVACEKEAMDKVAELKSFLMGGEPGSARYNVSETSLDAQDWLASLLKHNESMLSNSEPYIPLKPADCCLVIVHHCMEKQIPANTDMRERNPRRRLQESGEAETSLLFLHLGHRSPLQAYRKGPLCQTALRMRPPCHGLVLAVQEHMVLLDGAPSELSLHTHLHTYIHMHT